jgi:hypothetical protein
MLPLTSVVQIEHSRACGSHDDVCSSLGYRLASGASCSALLQPTKQGLCVEHSQGCCRHSMAQRFVTPSKQLHQRYSAACLTTACCSGAGTHQSQHSNSRQRYVGSFSSCIRISPVRQHDNVEVLVPKFRANRGNTPPVTVTVTGQQFSLLERA